MLVGRLLKTHAAVYLAFFTLALLWRLFLHWQLNQGIDQLPWYLASQCLTIPEFLFSQTPFLGFILLPALLYSSSKENLLSSFPRIGMDQRPLLVLIVGFSFCFCLTSIALRERQGYRWKKRGEELYRQHVLYENHPKNRKELLSYSRFIKIAPKTIMFYQRAEKSSDSRLLHQIMLDDWQSETLYSAAKAQIIASKLYMKDVQTYAPQNTPQKHLNDRVAREAVVQAAPLEIKSFKRMEREIGTAADRLLSFSASGIWNMDTLTLHKAAAAAGEAGSDSANYLKALLGLRLLPLGLFALLSLFYLTFKKMARIDSLAKAIGKASAGVLFALFFLYTTIYLILG